MISKELLSEVFADEGNMCTGNIQVTSRIIHYERNGSHMSQINIYELAHKCKEWARMNRYDLCSWLTFNKARCSVFESIALGWDEIITSFEADTEPEAIFKACQWILDNKDKQ